MLSTPFLTMCGDYMEWFYPEMSETEVNRIGMLGLAHVGDAVYELLIRSMLCSRGPAAVSSLHRSSVSMVKAQAQAEAAKLIFPELHEDEKAVYKRGRNTKVNSVPHNADIGHYHAATGLEALFGWLYMQGKIERINEIFSMIMKEKADAL